jgi:ABC-2 type transport system permease protein
VALSYSQDVAMREMRRLGGYMLDPLLDVRPRVWYNADLESKNYIVPASSPSS